MSGKVRRSLRTQTDIGGMLDGISTVLGALVVLTPFLSLYTGNIRPC